MSVFECAINGIRAQGVQDSGVKINSLIQVQFKQFQKTQKPVLTRIFGERPRSTFCRCRHHRRRRRRRQSFQRQK